MDEHAFPPTGFAVALARLFVTPVLGFTVVLGKCGGSVVHRQMSEPEVNDSRLTDTL